MSYRFGISWIALMMGLAVGVALGLFYAWAIAPVVEFDTQPWQLNDEARLNYMTAISLAYRTDGDLQNAVNRLIELRLGDDPFQALADTACDLFRHGIDDDSKRNAIESMIALYRPQGRSGCADQLNLFTIGQETATPFPTAIPVTPTLAPPASKTPTLTSPLNVTPPTVAPTRTPTQVPREDDFVLGPIQTYCSTELAGIIEVYTGEPGIEVRVTWESGEDRFFSGLKPERGEGYADFKMEANRGYVVDIPGRSRRTVSLTASACTTDGGQRSTTSYRVIFRRS